MENKATTATKKARAALEKLGIPIPTESHIFTDDYLKKLARLDDKYVKDTDSIPYILINLDTGAMELMPTKTSLTGPNSIGVTPRSGWKNIAIGVGGVKTVGKVKIIRLPRGYGV